jgi:hypothetical protein
MTMKLFYYLSNLSECLAVTCGHWLVHLSGLSRTASLASLRMATAMPIRKITTRSQPGRMVSYSNNGRRVAVRPPITAK